MPKFSVIGCLVLLFVPKINIIEIAGQNAGLRVDDLLLGFIAVAFLCSLKPSVRVPRAAILFAFFTAAGVASCVINGILPVYPVRLVEYFVFFYAGLYTWDRATLPRAAEAWLWLHLALMPLQYLGVVGAFSVGTYIPDCSDRVMGITAGPWEVSATINLIYAYLLFACEGFSLNRVIAFTAAGFVLHGLAASRTGLLVHAILAAAYLTRVLLQKGKHLQLLFGAGVACIIGIGGILYFGNALARSQSLFSAANVTRTIQVYEEADVSKGTGANINEVADQAFGEDPAVYDISLLARSFKWTYVIKTYLEASPLQALLGLGPGVWGPAVDGGILRLVTENGLVGSLLFVTFLITLVPNRRGMRLCMCVLLLNMVFIDIYLAYKFMSVFFVLFGGARAQVPVLRMFPLRQAEDEMTPAPVAG